MIEPNFTGFINQFSYLAFHPEVIGEESKPDLPFILNLDVVIEPSLNATNR